MLVVSGILYFAWPPLYNVLVKFGESIVGLGPVGAGIYAFFNRLLIPTGLHHALNSVFWFDVAGINDIGNFWAGTGTKGITGMYQAGFFPVMMFGLPAGALAMYHTAKDNKKKIAAGLLIAAAFASFFTIGILLHVPGSGPLCCPCTADRYLCGSGCNAPCNRRVQF